MFVDQNNKAILQADNTPVIKTWLELERESLDAQLGAEERQAEIDLIEESNVGPLSDLGISQ